MSGQNYLRLSIITVTLAASVFTVLLAIPRHDDLVNPSPTKYAYNYLALGDSYTIGESVRENETWPSLLTEALVDKGLPVKSTKLIAKTGWRTDQLLKAATEEVGHKKFEMVSLLIGVNNEFQGQDTSTFKKEFIKCLTFAIDHCYSKNGVFVLSIPDYGFTPYGENNQAKISERIDQYNAICKRVSTENHIAFHDITPISRMGMRQPDLVARDGLHPSAKQYKQWIAAIKEAVYLGLKR